jgi:hypothetical protein
LRHHADAGSIDEELVGGAASSGLSKARTKTSSISSRIARPPLPCARLMCVSRSVAVFRRGGGSSSFMS